MVQGVKYHIPEPDYYHTNTQPKQHQRQQNQNVYLPSPPSIKELCTPGILNYMATDCMVKKQGHWTAN